MLSKLHERLVRRRAAVHAREMRTVLLWLVPLGLLAQTQTPPDPAISPFGVRNGASLAPGGLIYAQGLAPGAIFVVQGAWLGPDEIALATVPYPTELAGVQLEVRTGSGEVFLAPLIHAWEFQVSGILPPEFPVGPGEVTVVYQGRRSRPKAVQAVDSSPALFSLSQTGIGRAVVQNWEGPESTPLNQFTRPAQPGQTVILWGTGLNNPDGSREIVVSIGDGPERVDVTPFYAGPAPGLPGVDQINLTLPEEGLPEGCVLGLSIRAGGAGSGSTTMAIAAGDGPCSHPWGLSEAELRTLDEGGQVRYASFTLNDTQAPDLNAEGLRPLVTAHAQTQFIAADGLASVTGPRSAPFASALLTCGAASRFGATFIEGDFSEPLPQPPPPDRLPREFEAHAGDPLVLLGPDGQRFDLSLAVPTEAPALASYALVDSLDAGAFAPGTWTLQAPGGDDIEAFEGSIELPRFPSVAAPERIRREEDIVVFWNGLGYSGELTLRVDIAVRYTDDQGRSQQRAVGCTAGADVLSGFRIFRSNFANLPAPDSGMAEFTVSIDAEASFESPALSHGTASYRAARTTLVPFE